MRFERVSHSSHKRQRISKKPLPVVNLDEEITSDEEDEFFEFEESKTEEKDDETANEKRIRF